MRFLAVTGFSLNNIIHITMCDSMEGAMNSKEALKNLRDIIGEETYRQVLEQLAGATVYFPALPSNVEWLDKGQRNESLKEDFYSGKYEVGDLARKYDLSISRVYKIIQGKT